VVSYDSRRRKPRQQEDTSLGLANGSGGFCTCGVGLDRMASGIADDTALRPYAGTHLHLIQITQSISDIEGPVLIRTGTHLAQTPLSIQSSGSNSASTRCVRLVDRTINSGSGRHGELQTVRSTAQRSLVVCAGRRRGEDVATGRLDRFQDTRLIYGMR
jgi:hypothetical protein